MQKTYIILIFLIFFSTNLFGRNEALNWYFGDKAAISFKTKDGDPIPISGSMLSTLEGCSSISDTNGNLLFYTDGVEVWNKNHQIMNLKQRLFGHFSSAQSALIIQKPHSKNIYYIFTVDAGEYVENIDTTIYENRGLNYSIVDMSLNDSLGKITDFNILLTKPVTEKLSSIFHKNKKDIWILAHEWDTKKYISFLLTENGISQGIKSDGAILYSGDIERYIGNLKISPNGKYIATTIQGLNYIEIAEFDNQTGKVSNPIIMNTGKRFNNYGIEFSPNSKLIYISDYEKKTLHQYNISVYDTSDIKKSETLIYKDTVSHSIGALQLAPNGKIYLALNQRKHLACIEKPDSIGKSCNFIFEAVFLANEYDVRSRHGLPNLNQSYYDFKGKIDYQYTCYGEPLVLNSVVNSEFKDINYKWTSPNGKVTYEKNLVIPNANPQLNGKYTLEVSYRDFIDYDTVEVIIVEKPKVKIIGDTIICLNTKARLNPSIVSDSLIYIWSNGEMGDELVISSPGVYSLKTIFPDGCSVNDTIVVKGLITNAQYVNNKVGFFEDLPIETNQKLIFEFKNFDKDSIYINTVFIKNKTQNIKILNPEKAIGFLKTNESKTIELNLFSSNPISISDSLVIEVSSPYCSIFFSCPIVGNIYVPVKIMMPQIKGSPADIIKIPFGIKINIDTKSKFDLTYSSKLSFPVDYFYPDSCINCKINSNYVQNDRRYIGVSGSINNLSKNESLLFFLVGKVLIGKKEATKINIDTIEWSNPLFKNEYSLGDFIVEGCSTPIRPIKIFEPTTLNIYPNPIKDYVTIKIRTEEKGTFELLLIDNLGKKINLDRWIRTELDTREYEFTYDLSKFNTGIYRLILKSPWYIFSDNILLVK